MNFIAELKRRNVLRAGFLYIASVWALAQGIAQLGPSVGAPEWVTRWFLVAAVLGFPFWLAFAWFFEFTPSGLKRESEIDPTDPVAHTRGRKFNVGIGAALAVVVVLLLTNHFVARRDASNAAVAHTSESVATNSAKVPEKSIAVLPLANESGDPKQQDFSDGLSEELISDLTQINTLKVIGKYSSFKFRDSKDSPAQIGATLGVAHLLSGSVRQQGQRVRIRVDLTKAADGSSVWSQTYDRDLKDVFAIQSEIGQAVAAALKIQLLGRALVADDKPPSGDVEAYQLMLQGRSIARRNTEAAFQEAIPIVLQALQRDPDYAYAWAVLGNTATNLGSFYLHGAAQEAAYAQGRAAADKALALAPDLPSVHSTRANLLQLVDGNPLAALAEARRALALAPNDGVSMVFVANILASLGQLRDSIDLYRRALATNPLRADWYQSLSAPLMADGQLDAAEQALRQVILLAPGSSRTYASLAYVDILRGDGAEAQSNAAKETDPDNKAIAVALSTQIDADAAQTDAILNDYVSANGSTQPYNVALLYALRKDPTHMFDWLERAWITQPGDVTASLLFEPLLLRYKDDPRFAAFCKKIRVPPPGTVLT